LKQGGLFVFNTQGADYDFGDEDINTLHIFHHPFYKAFHESIYKQLGHEVPKTNSVKAYHEERVRQVLSENGFKFLRLKNTIIERPYNSLIETCLVCTGNMGIFQSEGIEISNEERAKIIERAVEENLEKGLLESKPVAEVGVHFVAQKL